jgi:hypothetical protein
MKHSLISAFLLLASLCAAHSAEPAPAEAPSAEQFSFVQMCDTQLGMGGYEHDVKTFTLAVDQINGMKPDFVVICGDLVNKANDTFLGGFHEDQSGLQASLSLCFRESRCRERAHCRVVEALPREDGEGLLRRGSQGFHLCDREYPTLESTDERRVRET